MSSAATLVNTARNNFSGSLRALSFDERQSSKKNSFRTIIRKYTDNSILKYRIPVIVLGMVARYCAVLDQNKRSTLNGTKVPSCNGLVDRAAAALARHVHRIQRSHHASDLNGCAKFVRIGRSSAPPMTVHLTNTRRALASLQLLTGTRAVQRRSVESAACT